MLTTKQEAFVAKYLECDNATKAYRHAYNTENCSEAVENNEASLLLKNREIAMIIKDIKDEVLEAIVVDRAYIAKEVLGTIDEAKKDREHNTVLKGYDMLGKMYDLNEDKQNDRLVSMKDKTALVENYKRRMLDVTPGETDAKP